MSTTTTTLALPAVGERLWVKIRGSEVRGVVVRHLSAKLFQVNTAEDVLSCSLSDVRRDAK